MRFMIIQMLCVTEYGTANGRLHFLAVHFMRTLPTCFFFQAEDGILGFHVTGVQTCALPIFSAHEVSEKLFKILVEKSEGNPLYVEEILRQLQETAGLVVEDGEARLQGSDVTVPATIHDIIAARVDRLAQQLKQTLQGAAIIGRRFGVSLVSRVLEVLGDQVADHLRDLHGLDFVFPSAQEPELMYSFKHALTQDVVYASVLE